MGSSNTIAGRAVSKGIGVNQNRGRDLAKHILNRIGEHLLTSGCEVPCTLWDQATGGGGIVRTRGKQQTLAGLNNTSAFIMRKYGLTLRTEMIYGVNLSGICLISAGLS